MSYIGYTPQISCILIPALKKNYIYWDFVEDYNMKNYNIYRSDDSAGYVLINQVDYYNIDGSYSRYRYIDEVSDQYTSRDYKITGVDVNGVESLISDSDYHTPPRWKTPTSLWAYGYKINGIYATDLILGNLDVRTDEEEYNFSYSFYTVNTETICQRTNYEFDLVYSGLTRTPNSIEFDYTDSVMHDMVGGDVPVSTGWESIIPAMTSYTSPSGILTTSSSYGSAYAGWKAVDSDTTSIWLGQHNQLPYELQYECEAQEHVEQYYILPQMWGNENRSPKDFTLQGSNTGNANDWDILDQRSVDVSEWLDTYATTGKGIYFDVDPSTSGDYKYYKLNVTSLCGSTLISIRHFELLVQNNFY